MRCTEEFTDREAAARLYSDCKLAGHARVTAVSRQVREIEPPALYNLTELQKDANNYYGMTAASLKRDGSAYSKEKASLQEGNTASPPSRNWKTGRRPLLPDAA